MITIYQQNDLVKTLLKFLSKDTSNRKEEEIVDELLKLLNAEKIDVRVIYDGEELPNIIAKYGNDKHKIALIAHADTVPIGSREKWKFNPYGELKDNKIYGRGAIDFKGPLVAQLYTFLTLVEEGVKGIKFMVFSNEERQTMNSGARWMIKNKWDFVKTDYAIGEGGGVLSLKGRKLLIIGYGERGAAEYICRIIDESKHTSLETDYMLSKLIKKLMENKKEIRVRTNNSELNKFLDAIARSRFEKLLFRFIPKAKKLLKGYNLIEIVISNLSLGGNGIYYNMSPSELKIVLNIRYPQGVSEPFIEEIVKSRLGIFTANKLKSEIKKTIHIPPNKSPLSNEFVEFLSSYATELGYSLMAPMIIPASTDLAWFRNKGIPSYGVLPGTENILASLLTAHSPDEYITIQDLYAIYRNLVAIVKKFKEVN